jgi:uncharacterized membrane protein YdbT with pleckstrin-like domain
MLAPAFWLLVSIAAVSAAAIMLPTGAGNLALIAVGAGALILFLWLVFAPFVVWRSTHYVFTTKQVLFREGVLRREERGIPLAKVNDVKATQNLLERLLGCGTLTVESAGEHGQSVLKNIPRVVRVMNTLKDLVEADSDNRSLDEGELRAALREHREAGGNV